MTLWSMLAAGWWASWWHGDTGRDECPSAGTWSMCTASGVKNALGPDVMNDRDLPAFLRGFFSAFGDATVPVPAPLDLARHLVCGALDYARELGFPPHPDFQPTSGHLGTWQETSDITFGRDGVPFYVGGPYDDAVAVTRTLARSAGTGNFHFITPVGVTAG